MVAPTEMERMASGFFTDTTLCIGCKACEVACKQWNQLPADGYEFSGNSYDNTMALGATTWRHVAFVEQAAPPEAPPTETKWLMMSDVCKHCTNAGCMEACPTGAIIRNEFEDVFIQPDVCNGCGYCVPSCPFGVVDLIDRQVIQPRFASDGRSDDNALQTHGGVAGKCTLCYDRLKADLTPARAKACPTESIQFGNLEDLRVNAQARVEKLHEQGLKDAYLYGASKEDQPGTEGLNAFFLLVDKPEAYNLPPDPVVPTKKAGDAWRAMGYAAAGMILTALGTAFLGGKRA